MSTRPPAVRGRFITLEGIEGVGKSTNLSVVVEELRRRGKTVVQTREPGGVPLAERIRDIILRADDGSIDVRTELLLIFAARAAHLSTLIVPSLERGDWVVCDRFTDATYAYQGAGRGVDLDVIDDLKRWVQGSFEPDLTILLDAPWDEVATRLESRTVRDRFEREDAAFFNRIRSGYLELARSAPQRIRIVDASRPLQEVQGTIRQMINSWISTVL